MISSLISLKNKGRDADNRIQIIAFFYRIANQLVNQARGNKGRVAAQYTILLTFCRLELPCQAEMRKQSLRVITDGKAGTAARLSVDSRTSCSQIIQTASKCHHVAVHMVTQSFPSPMISCVESLPQGAHLSQIIAADSEHEHSKSYDVSTTSKFLRDIHISTRLMEDFLELAKDNTDKDLETCGILGAFLEKGTFYATTLIIPKQESTSSSCEAINEEEVFAIQNEGSLFPVGWIHTHPSQSCFMSSVDLHTQYSYQAMVPEAFAIVMAPTDTSRSYGIFRLSEPGGMSVLKECQEKGFHPHQEPADERPIYEHCSNIYKNSNLRFEIFDLR